MKIQDHSFILSFFFFFFFERTLTERWTDKQMDRPKAIFQKLGHNRRQKRQNFLSVGLFKAQF